MLSSNACEASKEARAPASIKTLAQSSVTLPQTATPCRTLDRSTHAWLCALICDSVSYMGAACARSTAAAQHR